MIPMFLTTVPKFVLALLATLAVGGGAVVVTAAVGGPNLPAQALHAIGVRTNQAKQVAIGTPSAAATEFLGLCQADSSGSEQGQAQKQNAPGFARLQDAAKAAGLTVAQFCIPILATGTPSATTAEFRGLCQADPSGSAQGQAQKQNAPGFARLQDAAKVAGLTVAQFCAPILSSSGKGN